MSTADTDGPAPKLRSTSLFWRQIGDPTFFIASVLLLAVSGFATWSGMSDFIRGLEGEVDQTTRIVVTAIVVVLTFLMWLSLIEVVGRGRPVWRRLIMLPLYLLLALWSIGFGYGYWWSLIAGQTATIEGLQAQAEDVRDAGAEIRGRLDSVSVQLNGVVRFSGSRMVEEEGRGGSCGIASAPGRGPLWSARRQVRDDVDQLNSDIRGQWLGSVESELRTLGEEVARFTNQPGADVAGRRAAFEAAASAVRDRARGIAASSNGQGTAFGTRMRQLAARLSVAPNEDGFSCYDPELAQLLRDAAEAAEQPVDIRLRDAAFSEGAAGVAIAVFSMWDFIGERLGLDALSPDMGDAVEQRRPIGGRDLIALLATVAVDLGIFVLTLVGRPPKPLRTQQFSEQVRGVVRQAMTNAIHRSGEPVEWLRLHFVHHLKTSYFVVPNYYAIGDDPKKGFQPPSESDQPFRVKAHALNQLAGVLDDIEIIEALSQRGLKRAQKEEQRASASQIPMPAEIAPDDGADLEPYQRERDRVIRNHGLLSKARRALINAGWTGEACRDFEVYRLVDAEGLTPLLDVLSSPELEKIAPNRPKQPTTAPGGEAAKALPASETKALPPA